MHVFADDGLAYSGSETIPRDFVLDLPKFQNQTKFRQVLPKKKLQKRQDKLQELEIKKS